MAIVRICHIVRNDSVEVYMEGEKHFIATY